MHNVILTILCFIYAFVQPLQLHVFVQKAWGIHS